MRTISLILAFLAGVILLLVSCEQGGKSRADVTFQHVNVVSMTSGKIIPNQTVQVLEGKISRIVSAKKRIKKTDGKVIDGQNMYLMPGLADMHTHPAEYYEPVPPLNLFLANGVTTIRSMDGKTGNFILRWRDEVAKGSRPGPQILAAGPFVYIPDHADTLLRMQKNQGFDFVKISSFMPREVSDRVFRAQKDMNLYIAGHIPYELGLKGSVREGMNEIAHIEEVVFSTGYEYDYEKDLLPLPYNQWYNFILKSFGRELQSFEGDLNALLRSKEEKMQDICRFLASSNTVVNTTVYVDQVLRMKRYAPEELLRKPEFQYIPDSYKDGLLAGKDRNHSTDLLIMAGAKVKYALDSVYLGMLHQAGVKLVAGTDAFPGMGIVPGYSIYDELQTLVKYGLTPYEALKLATVNASEACAGISGKDDFGRIEEGMRADLVLLKENPLEDIAALKSIQGVMAGGSWYPKNQLEEMVRIEKEKIPVSGRKPFMQTYDSEGLETAMALIQKSKSTVNKEDRLIFDENTLTWIGYDLIKKKKPEDALKIFDLTVREYPYSSNAWDCLGETWLNLGQKEKAREYYQKALTLNPGSERIQKILDEMKE